MLEVQMRQILTEKWCQIFIRFRIENINTDNIKCLVSFRLALPESNLAVKRVCSIANALWLDEGNRLAIATVKALTIVQTHWKDFSSVKYSMLKYLKRKKS